MHTRRRLANMLLEDHVCMPESHSCHYCPITGFISLPVMYFSTLFLASTASFNSSGWSPFNPFMHYFAVPHILLHFMSVVQVLIDTVDILFHNFIFLFDFGI